MNNGVNNNTVQQQPVTTQQPVLTPVPQQVQPQPVPVKKKKSSISILLLFIILGLIGYIIYTNKNYTNTINNIKNNCTPISAGEEKELDINSTLVQDLYSKVQTNIKEDIANPEFNDNLKLYLAYRQILEKNKYESNCNLFKDTNMEPYTCTVTNNFTPKAFKEELLIRELKKLFGENNTIQLDNIQLGNSCIVGYQYIKERGEYVEGYCNKKMATSFKVTKDIIKATSTQNSIIITENVKYHPTEGQDVPEYLKSGTYKYEFKLDMNYNYILVNKTFENKY